LSWTKQTKATAGETVGWGDQAWGSAWGGIIGTGWTNQAKASDIWTNQSKITDSWTKQTKASE
jgi:hypothetical protein